MRIVVEGASDEGAARRVVEVAGHVVERVTIKKGKSNLDRDLAKYCQAARRESWVVFRDSDEQCPVTLRAMLMSGLSFHPSRFQLRIAHSMTEAWLMADRKGFAAYFRVSADAVPVDPERSGHAKRVLLALCRKSTSRDIRAEVAFSEREAGPLFVEHLNEFAARHWDPTVAAENAPSLASAIAAISAMTP